MAIIAIPEFRDRLSHLFDIPEDAPMNGLFFQGSVESFSNTMGLRFGNEGKAGGGSQSGPRAATRYNPRIR